METAAYSEISTIGGQSGRAEPPVFEPPVLPDEAERLEAVDRFQETLPLLGHTLDRVAGLAGMLFRVPIALVSLVNHDRQCFIGRTGTDIEGTARDISFCAYTIACDSIFTVPDARQDPRFANNPLVTGDPQIRFYAGAPIRSSSGHNIGSLCLIDVKPRPELRPEETALLHQLADMAITHMEDHLRLTKAE